MPELGPVTVHEMRFEIPQVVLDNEPDYEEGKMFSSISIKPMQIDTPGVCGVEVNYALHDDPVERLTQKYLENSSPSNPGYVYLPDDEKAHWRAMFDPMSALFWWSAPTTSIGVSPILPPNSSAAIFAASSEPVPPSAE